jgi:hypothetical protein
MRARRWVTSGSPAPYLREVRFYSDSGPRGRLEPVRLRADSVEKVGSSFVVSAHCSADELAWLASRGRQRGHRDQLGHLTEVLSGGSEGELVTRAVRAP